MPDEWMFYQQLLKGDVRMASVFIPIDQCGRNRTNQNMRPKTAVVRLLAYTLQNSPKEAELESATLRPTRCPDYRR